MNELKVGYWYFSEFNPEKNDFYPAKYKVPILMQYTGSQHVSCCDVLAFIILKDGSVEFFPDAISRYKNIIEIPKTHVFNILSSLKSDRVLSGVDSNTTNAVSEISRKLKEVGRLEHSLIKADEIFTFEPIKQYENE